MDISHLYKLNFHLLKSNFSTLEIILNSFVVSSTFYQSFTLLFTFYLSACLCISGQ